MQQAINDDDAPEAIEDLAQHAARQGFTFRQGATGYMLIRGPRSIHSGDLKSLKAALRSSGERHTPLYQK